MSEALLAVINSSLKVRALRCVCVCVPLTRLGIFFKLSRDRDNMYGGDSNASKSAGHELKSLNELQNLEISGLCYPLFAIIDFRGFVAHNDTTHNTT